VVNREVPPQFLELDCQILLEGKEEFAMIRGDQGGLAGSDEHKAARALLPVDGIV
jgi:hypothetical protein